MRQLTPARKRTKSLSIIGTYIVKLNESLIIYIRAQGWYPYWRDTAKTVE
jgi:hypothetical protein